MCLAAFVAAMSASAQDWTAPVYSGAYQPLTAGDTVYIYNTEAKQFLTEGNDWGTHGTVGNSGLKCWLNQYAANGAEWDGETYTIGVESVEKGGIYLMFIESGGHLYVDGSDAKSDFLFSFKSLGDNTYQIFGAAGNPTYNATGEMADYMLGRYTGYTDTKDGLETGTGVIYDYNGADTDYAAGEFQTVWAFVSKADYATYAEQLSTYESALELGEAIAQAETLSVPDIDAEKAVYANTSSTKADIEAAIASLEKKTLAYYEKVVTPDNPITICEDACDEITEWTNDINATTWNTQTWIGDGWTGFDGTTLNIWGSSMTGEAYREFVDIPNGIYVVSMAVFSQDKEGYVFANDNKKSVAAGAAGNTYQVTTEVTDGTIKFGFGQDETGTNWVALDNAVLKYYGSGVEAYRYWLSGLLESAPSFDDVTAQTALVEEYEKVLASVNTVTTKEEILAIIPSYEEILNRINLNIAAYDALSSAVETANNMAANEEINVYYSDLIVDAVTEKTDIIENHTASTEEVQNATTDLQTITDEAQNYIWNMEKLTAEKETAAGIFAEYGSTCSADAVGAYIEFADREIDKSTLTNAAVEALLEELYNIEFNLQVPAEAASDDNPVDYTAKINYPSFDGGAEGWTNEGWATCGSNSWTSFADGVIIDAAYLNLWNTTTANVYQTITDLPAGTYEVQISAFADAEGLQVYANECSMDVVAGQNSDGLASVYGTTTEAYDGTGVYYGNIYKIIVEVTDGTLVIGARQSQDATVWAMIDNVKLTYYGTQSEKTPTDITTVESNSQIAAIYSISGTRTNVLGKGLNIVKYADGQVKKVLVK